jgi:hypothetical protein
MDRIKVLIPTLLLLAALSAKSQSIQRDSLAGTWICVEAMPPDNEKMGKEEKDVLNVLAQAIENSKFVFKTNGLFQWQFPKGLPAVLQGMDFLNNKKWSIDPKNGLNHIGDPKDNVMQITIDEKQGIVYFMLSDTPLLLRMRKE